MIIRGILNILTVICAFMSINAEIQNCSYLDTVELSEGDKLQNGSYVYEGVLIPPDLIGEYDYEFRYGDRVERLNHTRGCVCKLKPCIRICCHPKSVIDKESGECVGEVVQNLALNPFIKITYENGSKGEMHVLDDFVAQQGMPCSNIYVLSAETSDLDNWDLFENGTLLRNFDQQFLSKQEYCMQPAWHEILKAYVFKPHNCAVQHEPSDFEKFISYIMFISVIFFILTILIYLCTPKLQNLNGKCQICYLTALAVAFTMLNVSVHFNLPTLLCYIVGYFGYFSIISAFAWSSVISLDIWNTFRSRHFAMRPNAIFIQYNVAAWGFGVFLTLIIFFIDLFSDVEGDWSSGIGYYACWVLTSKTIPKIYLYGPMVIMLIFNITMFILSALKIAEINRRLKQSEVREEHAKRLRSNLKMFFLFLRLFFIMGIVWILELFSTFDIENETMESLTVFSDILSALQGVIIFLLLILRPKVRRTILRKKQNAANRDDSSDEGFSLQGKTIALSTLN